MFCIRPSFHRTLTALNFPPTDTRLDRSPPVWPRLAPRATSSRNDPLGPRKTSSPAHGSGHSRAMIPAACRSSSARRCRSAAQRATPPLRESAAVSSRWAKSHPLIPAGSTSASRGSPPSMTRCPNQRSRRSTGAWWRALLPPVLVERDRSGCSAPQQVDLGPAIAWATASSGRASPAFASSSEIQRTATAAPANANTAVAIMPARKASIEADRSAVLP